MLPRVNEKNRTPLHNKAVLICKKYKFMIDEISEIRNCRSYEVVSMIIDKYFNENIDNIMRYERMPDAYFNGTNKFSHKKDHEVSLYINIMSFFNLKKLAKYTNRTQKQIMDIATQDYFHVAKGSKFARHETSPILPKKDRKVYDDQSIIRKEEAEIMGWRRQEIVHNERARLRKEEIESEKLVRSRLVSKSNLKDKEDTLQKKKIKNDERKRLNEKIANKAEKRRLIKAYNRFDMVVKYERTTMTYFFQCNSSKHIKIGFTNNVKKRHPHLSSSSAMGLKFLGFYHSDVEKYLHRLFDDQRVNPDNEFFDITIDDIENNKVDGVELVIFE